MSVELVGHYYGDSYGALQYYSSETCLDYNTFSGCTTSYNDSEIKYVVDAWKTAEAPLATEARLITLDDLQDNLGLDNISFDSEKNGLVASGDTPTWLSGNEYSYWTMTPNDDSSNEVWVITDSKPFEIFSLGVSSISNYIGSANAGVRPVITLPKSALN